MEVKEKINSWRLWCRLCAKSDPTTNLDIFLKSEVDYTNEPAMDHIDGTPTFAKPLKEWDLNLAVAVEKYFLINIKPEEELPKMLCMECCNLITSLWNFSGRVAKVQQMFWSIHKSASECGNGHLDLNAIRMQHGILDENRIHVPEVHYFEATPEINVFEETESDALINKKNPLKLPRLAVKIKNEFSMEVEDNANTSDAAFDNNDSDISDRDHGDDGNDSVDDNVDGNEGDDEDYSPHKKVRKIKPTVKTSNNIVAKTKTNSKDNNINEIMGISNTITMKCGDCPRIFKRIKTYRKHMKKAHAKEIPIEEYPCIQCSRVFDLEQKLHLHLMKHAIQESKKNIPVVKKPASTEGRTFMCNECGVSLTSKAQLKLHLLIHADVKPYKCDICNTNFREKGTLKRHKQVHNPTRAICPECGLQLSSTTTLNQHMLVHSDEMKHKCEQCGRAFKRAKGLKYHLILHTGLRPYSCDFCGKTFTFGSSCRLHKRKMHPKELAEKEATGAKVYTHNIPNLSTLKAMTKVSCNLKQSVSNE